MPERRDEPLNPQLEQYLPTEREQQIYDLWQKTALATHKVLFDVLEQPALPRWEREYINQFCLLLHVAVHRHLQEGTFAYFHVNVPASRASKIDIGAQIASSLLAITPEEQTLYQAHLKTPDNTFYTPITIPTLYLRTETGTFHDDRPTRSIVGVGTLPSHLRPAPASSQPLGRVQPR